MTRTDLRCGSCPHTWEPQDPSESCPNCGSTIRVWAWNDPRRPLSLEEKIIREDMSERTRARDEHQRDQQQIARDEARDGAPAWRRK